MTCRFLTLLLLSLTLALTVGCAQDDADRATDLAAEAAQAQQAGNLVESFQKMQRAVELQPQVADYHISLGMNAMELGREEAAAESYAAAERLFAAKVDKSPQHVANHAMTLVLLGRPEDARKAIAKGLERFPEAQDLRKLYEDRERLIEGTQKYAIGGKPEPEEVPPAQ